MDLPKLEVIAAAVHVVVAEIMPVSISLYLMNYVAEISLLSKLE